MRPAALGLVFSLTACGAGAPRPEASAGRPVADAGAPVTMESQREPFMRSCLKSVRSEAYCACGFGEFRRIFAGADLSRPPPADDPRLAALSESTIAACGSTLTEADVRASFVEGCRHDDEHKGAYCECAWTHLRRRWTLADFLGPTPVAASKLDETKHQLAAACRGTLPADAVRADFMASCAKSPGVSAARCACMWTKIIARYRPEEIEGGLLDRAAVPGLADCR